MIPAEKSKPNPPPKLTKKAPNLNGVTIEQLEEALKVLEKF